MNVMKELLTFFLLTILPIVNQTNTSVTISGNIDPRVGEAITLTVSPNNDSYTYIWDCDGHWDNQEHYYDFLISSNQITITPKAIEVQMLRLNCSVYDESGNYMGSDEVEIIWHGFSNKYASK